MQGKRKNALVPIKDMNRLNQIMDMFKEKDDVIYLTLLILFTYGLSYEDIMKLKIDDVGSKGCLKDIKYNPLILCKEKCDEVLGAYCGSRRNLGLGPYLFSAKGIEKGNGANMGSKMARIASRELDLDITPGQMGVTYGYWYLHYYGTLAGSSYQYLQYRVSDIKEVFHLSQTEYDKMIASWLPVVDPEYRDLVADITRCISNAGKDIASEDEYRQELGRSFLGNLYSLVSDYKDSKKVVSDEISRLSSKILLKKANGMDTESDKSLLLNMIAMEGSKKELSKDSFESLHENACVLISEVKELLNKMVESNYSDNAKEALSEKLYELGIIFTDMAAGAPEYIDWVKELDEFKNLDGEERPRVEYGQRKDKYFAYIDNAMLSRNHEKYAFANALLLWLNNNLKYL